MAEVNDFLSLNFRYLERVEHGLLVAWIVLNVEIKENLTLDMYWTLFGAFKKKVFENNFDFLVF